MKSLWRKIITSIDWPLFLLLTVVTNQAILWVKVVGLLLVFLLRPQFRINRKEAPLPIFIPLIAGVGTLNFLFLIRDYSLSSCAAFGVSMAFWAAAFAGSWQVHLSLKNARFKVVPTLKLFTLLNVSISLVQVARIAWSNGAWNPYHQLPFPYGMSTGDWVMGIFGEVSHNNTFVSGLIAIFFLFRRQWVYATLCLFVEVLVFGNFIILSLSGILATGALLGLLALAFCSRVAFFRLPLFPKGHVIAAFICSAFLLMGFVVAISPENVHYIISFTKSKEVRNTPPTHSGPTKVSPKKSLWYKVAQLDFKKYNRPPLPADKSDLQVRHTITQQAVADLKGKKLSFMETAAYLSSGVRPLLMGAGPVRFSSLTAARMSGLDSSRIFTRLLPRYRSRSYAENHWLIHQYWSAGDAALRSNANWTDSFYNQLAGEYGLTGIGLFLFFYAGYYLKRWKQLSWGIWVCALMIPIAALTYLFEPLCVIFFFELLMGLDLVEEKPGLQL